MTGPEQRQKAPSAIRCIKTGQEYQTPGDHRGRQKAPSAIRCIKTEDDPTIRPPEDLVRKHRAP